MLESDRRSALQDLGAAAHAQDSTAEATVRARLAVLDAREAELRAQLDGALGEANERIRRARLPIQETMMVPPAEPGPDPPSK
jgi:multidrug resistance efflux pump